MAIKKLADIFQVGADVLDSEMEANTKTVLVQTGNVHEDYSLSDRAEWWQHVGFASRPSKPKKSEEKAAQCICATQGDRDVAFASRDTRDNGIYGSLDYGETCLYATGPDNEGQARILLKKDGSVNLYTRKGNTSSGEGMAIMITPSQDMISIVNSKGYGLIIDGDGVKLVAGSSSLLLGTTATLVSTGQTQIDGGSIVLGTNPVAVPPLFSALYGISGTLATPSLKVVIGS